MSCLSGSFISGCNRSITRTRTVLAAILALLLITGPARASDGLAALEQLSAETQAAIIVPELAHTNRVLGDLVRRYNLPLPQTGDLLSSFKREAGMYGVNDDGPLLLIFEGVGQAMRDGVAPTAYMLVPVSDYNAFVESYDGDAEAEVTTLSLSQHTGYARRLGDYALLGRTHESVADYAPAGAGERIGERLGRYGRDHLDGAMAALYVDVQALRPTLSEMFDAMAETHGKRSAWIDSLIQSVDATMLAIEADERGVALTQTVAYPSDSQLASLLPGDAADLGDELERLPDQPFMFAAAMDMRALGLDRWIERLGHVEARQEAVIEQGQALIEQTRAAANAYYLPTRQLLMAGNPVNQVTLIRVDDAQRYRATFKALIDALDGMPVTAPGADAAWGGASPTFASSYIDNALNIAGVGVDQYQLGPPSELRDQLDQLGPFAAMFGMQGTTGYIAAADGHVVITTQPDPQLVRRALQSIEQRDGLGAATTAQLAERQQQTQRQSRQQRQMYDDDDLYDDMPEWLEDDMVEPGRRRGASRRATSTFESADSDPASIAELRELALPRAAAFEGYISLTGTAHAVELVMPMFDAAAFGVPDDLPPLAIGVGVEESGLAGRIYLPHRTAAFISQVIAQFTAPPAEPEPRDTRRRRSR